MPETVINKYHSDLQALYYSKATVDSSTGAITYAVPVRIKNAISISLKKKGELITVKCDGEESVFGKDNSGYDGDLEVMRLPESFETDCLNRTKNTDGTIDEFESDNVSPFALLFQFKGDKKGVRHCLYWCYASDPDLEGDNPDKVAPKNEKVSIICRPRPTDGKIKTKTGDSITDAAYNSWFSSVHDQVAESNSSES